MNTVVMTLTVVTEDPHVVAKTADVLARTAAGLALDEVTCVVSMSVIEPDPETEDDDIAVGGTE